MAFAYDTTYLSKYRTQLMGIAILLIVYAHTTFNDLNIPFPLRVLKRQSYGGVDFFFFLSGLGIYFACAKETVKKFINRRLIRILPYYIPILFLYAFFFEYRNGLISFGGIFTRLFLLDYWFDSTSNGLGWYIPVAIVFYLLTPVMMKIIDFNKGNQVFFLIAALYITSIYILPVINNDLQRLAVYSLGLFIGSLIAKKKKINYLWLIVSFSIGIITLGLNYLNYPSGNPILAFNFRVIPYFFLVMPLCAAFTLIMSKFPGYKFPVLGFLGMHTLTIYIFHERLANISHYYFGHAPVNIFFIISATLVCATLWQKLIDYILKEKILIK